MDELHTHESHTHESHTHESHTHESHTLMSDMLICGLYHVVMPNESCPTCEGVMSRK